MRNAAIIGISGYGRVHLRMLEYQKPKGMIRLVAVVSVGPDQDVELLRELREEGCQVYSDYQTLLADWKGRLDLCMIPTPIHLHEEMAIAALQAGANVLVEKPLSTSVESCLRIQREERAAGKFVAVGFQKLYSPSNVKVKQLLVDGYLGRIDEIRGVTLWPRATNYYERNTWAGKERANGRLVLDSPLSNACAHFLHLMLYWASPDRNGVASLNDDIEAELYRVNCIESYDTASLSGTTDSVESLLFLASHASQETIDPMIRIVGESGLLEWKMGEGVRIESLGCEPLCFLPSSDEEEVREMIDRIVERIETGTGEICGIEQALPHVKIVEHLHRTFEIASIESEFVVTDVLDGYQRRFVPGLDHATLNAFHRGIHYSKTGQKWAKSSLGKNAFDDLEPVGK